MVVTETAGGQKFPQTAELAPAGSSCLRTERKSLVNPDLLHGQERVRERARLIIRQRALKGRWEVGRRLIASLCTKSRSHSFKIRLSNADDCDWRRAGGLVAHGHSSLEKNIVISLS